MSIDITPETYNAIRDTFTSHQNEIERLLIFARESIDTAWAEKKAIELDTAGVLLESAVELLKDLLGIQNALAEGTIARPAVIADRDIVPWIPAAVGKVEDNN